MGKKDEDRISVQNQEWAHKYILDPLTCPEPHQVTGPAGSFYRIESKEPTTPPQPEKQVPSRTKSFLQKVPERYRSLRERRSHKGYTVIDDPEFPTLTAENSKQWSRGTFFNRDGPDPAPINGNEAADGMARKGSTEKSYVESFSGLHRPGSNSARLSTSGGGSGSYHKMDSVKEDGHGVARARTTRRRKVSPRQPSDAIDWLDLSSPVQAPYHHDGPYDATMASRNANALYSPLSAVKDSNMEALKATPQEYIKDSLEKHVPLQGTAGIPSGMKDMRGHTMAYKEGADIMREADAPGGAYKRYDFIPYHQDDLKGKGEPSYTIERDRKEQKARVKKHQTRADNMEYEMLLGDDGPVQGGTRTQGRQRSASDAAVGTSSDMGPSVRPKRSHTLKKLTRQISTLLLRK